MVLDDGSTRVDRGRYISGATRKRGMLAGIAISTALLFAGCGGGTDSSSDSSASSDSTVAATTSGTTANTATTGPGSSVKTTPDTSTTTTSGTTPTTVTTPTTTNTVTTGNGTTSTTTVTHTPPAGGSVSPTAVAAIFNPNCGRCHKAGPLGQGRIALNHIGGEKDQTWIEVQIRNPSAHHSKMPAFGPSKISDADLHTLAQYLASLK